ncbi:MAG: conserved exported protein of unknown function [Promethearchaeota archaeon]|nr:MAG: conserved exported protein of unknown function [Candidatus Lokiarchaeota archaeon]
MILKGKSIVPGKVKARSLVSTTPISFLGDVDPDKGTIVDKQNALYGQSIAGKVFVFPLGKGSTVGSYVIYQLKKNQKAPIALINAEAEAIVAVGAIISDIPMVQGIDIDKIPNNKEVYVNASEGYLKL